MRIIATALIAATLTPLSALAADQALIDAAKKEGEVTWYTTSIVDQFVRPAAQAFEKKYGIKVNFIRSNALEIELRVSNEAKAGRIQADLVDGTTTSITLKKMNLVEKWTPDVKLPDRYKDPEGYWMASQEYVLMPGYNTDMIPKGSEPKNFEDLLNPRLKGKMVWNTTPSSSAGQGFVGLVLMEMGEEKGRAYLEKLAKQDVAGMKAAARQVLDQVVAGEYAIALQIFHNHTTISQARGAPVYFLKVEPGLGVVLPMSVLKNSPQCGQAAVRLHPLRRGAEADGGLRRIAGAAQRAAQGGGPAARPRHLPRHLSAAGKAGGIAGRMDEDLQRIFPLSARSANSLPTPAPGEGHDRLRHEQHLRENPARRNARHQGL